MSLVKGMSQKHLFDYRLIILTAVILLSITMQLRFMPRAVADDAVDSEANRAVSQTYNARQQLSDILTSDDYAEAESVENWQRIPKAKPPKTLDMEPSSSSWDLIIYILSVLIKGLLIAGLIAFIIWVVMRASGMSGWASKFLSSRRRKTAVSAYNALHLSQGWENLPEHTHIPDVIQSLIDNHKYTQAASILYRGSLRWLASSHAIHILPATTEMQCIKQIEQVHKLDGAGATIINESTKTYIINVIQTWLQIAYGPVIYEPQAGDTKIAKIEEHLVQSLQQLRQNWLAQLPVTTMMTIPSHNGKTIQSVPTDNLTPASNDSNDSNASKRGG